MTAVNLATAMAQAESQVLLVDADLRRPNLHKIFRIPQEPGLSNFLVGATDELPVVETVIPNLLVVPAGTIPPNPSELLLSTHTERFLDLALKQFGRVVVDSPPLMAATDAAILATMVEGVLLVIKAEAVPRKVTLKSLNSLLEIKAPVLGAVLNNAPFHHRGYYSHYYRYRSYYSSGDQATTRTGRHSGKVSPPKGVLARLKSRLPFFKGHSSLRS